jgi:hypothetical protein
VSPLVINHHTQPNFQGTEDLAFPLVDFRESPASFTDNKRNSLICVVGYRQLFASEMLRLHLSEEPLFGHLDDCSMAPSLQSRCLLFVTKRPGGINLACTIGWQYQGREHHED